MVPEMLQKSKFLLFFIQFYIFYIYVICFIIYLLYIHMHITCFLILLYISMFTLFDFKFA